MVRRQKVWYEPLGIMYSSGFNRVHSIQNMLVFEEYPVSNVDKLLPKLSYDSNTVTDCKIN